MASSVISGYFDHGAPGVSAGDSVLIASKGINQTVSVIEENGIYYVDQNSNGVVDDADFEINNSDIISFIDMPLGENSGDNAWVEIILFIYTSLEDRFARDKKSLKTAIDYDKVRTADYQNLYDAEKAEYDKAVKGYQDAKGKQGIFGNIFFKIFGFIAMGLIGLFTGGVGVALMFVAAAVAFEMVMQYTPLMQELAKLDTAWMVVAIVIIVVVAIALPMFAAQVYSKAAPAVATYFATNAPRIATWSANTAARFSGLAASAGLQLSSSSQVMLGTAVRIASASALAVDGGTQIYSGVLSIYEGKFHGRATNAKSEMTSIDGNKEIFQKMILFTYTILQGYLDDDFASAAQGMDDISSRGESYEFFISRTRS